MKKLLLASVLAIASIPGAHTAEQDFVTAKTEGAKTLEDHIAYCEGTYGDYHGEVPTKAETREKAAAVNRCIVEAKAEFAKAQKAEKEYNRCYNLTDTAKQEQCFNALSTPLERKCAKETLQDGE